MPQNGPTNEQDGHNREHVATTCGDIVESQIEKLRKHSPRCSSRRRLILTDCEPRSERSLNQGGGAFISRGPARMMLSDCCRRRGTDR